MSYVRIDQETGEITPSVITEAGMQPNSDQPPAGGGATDPAPAPDATPGPDSEIIVDPSFFGWLKGKWTMDLGRSQLPPNMPVELPEPITMTIEADGSFTVAAPLIVVRAELGEFDATIRGAGTMRVAGGLDASGQVPMTLDFAITERKLDTSKFKLPFSVEPIANFIFDAITARMPDGVLLSTAREADIDVLSLSSSGYVHRLTRPQVHARVERVTFIGRQRQMMEQIGPGPHRFRDPGVMLEAPEWIRGEKQAPISYLRGSAIAVEVQFSVAAPGRKFKLFGIDPANPALNFESDELVATGQPQTVTMHGKAKLPDYPARLVSDLVWNIQMADDQQWYWAGAFDKYRVFTTLAEPIGTTSYNEQNSMTPTRLDFVTAKLKPNTIKVADLASAIQQRVNGAGDMISLAKPSTLFDKKLSYKPDWVWSLLDADNKEQGNCGEATLLMEMMLEMIGIPAVQTHVYASSKPEVLAKGMNVIRSSAGQPDVGAGIEKRMCAHHGYEEQLMMAFDTARSGGSIVPNWGEGTVEVEGVLYSGIISNQARAGDGHHASHNLLIQLEDGSAKPHVVRFQVWMPVDDANNPGGETVCKFASPDKADMTLAEPPGVSVPR